MLDRHELAALAKSLGRVMKEGIAAAILAVSNRVDELEQHVKSIPAGPQGEKGEPGIAVVGEKGERGEPGEKGDPGERGEKGGPGPMGERGSLVVGDKGDPGQDGKDGKDGRDGRDGIAGQNGRDGQDGKDALQIEILSMIDPEKSYPRGTWARYKGGMIRASRNTDSISADLAKSGWEVMCEGVAGIVVRQEEDPRSFLIVTELTSGGGTMEKFFIPVPLYKQIFRHGTDYKKGDWVTCGGSGWECLVDDPKAGPGTNSAEWRLVIKRGEPGTKGDRGPEGPEGKPGRDGRDFTRMGMAGQ